MDFTKGACLQIQKSANIMYVAGAFRRNRVSKKYIEGAKNGNLQFVFIAKITAFQYFISETSSLCVFDSLETLFDSF